MPSARPSASSRIDLPAPVSPVSTQSPARKARSSRSISTTSRMVRPSSIGARTALRVRRCSGSGQAAHSQRIPCRRRGSASASRQHAARALAGRTCGIAFAAERGSRDDRGARRRRRRPCDAAEGSAQRCCSVMLGAAAVAPAATGESLVDVAEPAAGALVRCGRRRLGAAALGDRGRLPRLEERVAVAVPVAARDSCSRAPTAVRCASSVRPSDM